MPWHHLLRRRLSQSQKSRKRARAARVEEARRSKGSARCGACHPARNRIHLTANPSPSFELHRHRDERRQGAARRSPRHSAGSTGRPSDSHLHRPDLCRTGGGQAAEARPKTVGNRLLRNVARWDLPTRALSLLRAMRPGPDRRTSEKTPRRDD